MHVHILKLTGNILTAKHGHVHIFVYIILPFPMAFLLVKSMSNTYITYIIIIVLFFRKINLNFLTYKNMEIFGVEVTLLSINSVLKKKLLIVGIRHEIRDLKVELESMRSFLRVANKCNNDQNESYDFWVAQVQDAAYKVEDVIDEFIYHMENIRGGDGQSFKGFFHRFLRLPKEIYVKFYTAIKLKRIKAEIKEIANRSKRYDLGHIDEGSVYLHSSFL